MYVKATMISTRNAPAARPSCANTPAIDTVSATVSASDGSSARGGRSAARRLPPSSSTTSTLIVT